MNFGGLPLKMKDYCPYDVPPLHLLALQLVQYVNFKLNISWHKNKISSYYIIKPLKSQFDTNSKPCSLVFIDANNGIYTSIKWSGDGDLSQIMFLTSNKGGLGAHG